MFFISTFSPFVPAFFTFPNSLAQQLTFTLWCQRRYSVFSFMVFNLLSWHKCVSLFQECVWSVRRQFMDPARPARPWEACTTTPASPAAPAVSTCCHFGTFASSSEHCSQLTKRTSPPLITGFTCEWKWHLPRSFPSLVKAHHYWEITVEYIATVYLVGVPVIPTEKKQKTFF